VVGGVGYPEYVAVGFGAIWVASWSPSTTNKSADTPFSEPAVIKLDPLTGEPVARVALKGEQFVSMAAPSTRRNARRVHRWANLTGSLTSGFA
jgi:hypothetical protein